MTQEQLEKATSALKKAYNAVTVALGLCIIAIAALVVGTILLVVSLEFFKESETTKKQNGCIHLQGVPGCYRNPNGYYGGPHNPNPRSHLPPQPSPAPYSHGRY